MLYRPTNPGFSLIEWYGRLIASRRRRRAGDDLRSLSAYLQRDLGFIDRDFP